MLRAAFGRLGLERLCAACPDRCCARFSFEQLVEPTDLTVLPAEMRPAARSSSPPCRHLMPTGCALPADRRPWVCVSHVCEQWAAAMSDSQALELQRLFARLDAAYGRVQQVAETLPAP